MDDDLSYLVQLRAHEIWQSRGCRNGTHLENCAQAERELGAGSTRPQPHLDVSATGPAREAGGVKAASSL